MCRMFYIGANRPLSSVDQTNQVPDLGVTQIIGEVETCVRSVIAYPFLYYVASWQGCSCGFYYEDRAELEYGLSEIPDEAVCATCRDYWQRGYNSVQLLGHYLNEQVQLGSITLYVAWAGLEGKPIKHQQSVTPKYFGGSAFDPIPEDSLLTITLDR